MSSSHAPAPGRLYWICQCAGWGGFSVYVLAAYLFNARPWHAWDVASILFVNGALCPLLTHGLRLLMHERGWIALPRWQLLPRLALAVALLGASLTGIVVLAVKILDGGSLPLAGVFGTLAAFWWALTGWLVIYFVVHARRRRDAQQLELTIIARDAQLRALRAQLNPHFLFNCLNSLRHLIAADPPRAEAMVTGLAELLRYSLAADRTDTVTLDEELRVVDEYLELERVRFDERLRVERAIEPRALAVRIPPMLIQTLVDNAIKHGISELPAGGVVRISARVTDSRLEVIITNTGAPTLPAESRGHGLHNSRERLRLLYGEAASLTLRARDGTTEASLLLPAGIMPS